MEEYEFINIVKKYFPKLKEYLVIFIILKDFLEIVEIMGYIIMKIKKAVTKYYLYYLH